jgi:hypothetical protein
MDNLIHKLGPTPSMVLPNCSLKNGTILQFEWQSSLYTLSLCEEELKHVSKKDFKFGATDRDHLGTKNIVEGKAQGDSL